jgi:hypothetical protein
LIQASCATDFWTHLWVLWGSFQAVGEESPLQGPPGLVFFCARKRSIFFGSSSYSSRLGVSATDIVWMEACEKV